MSLLPALIGAAGSLIGGLFGDKAAKKQNQQQIRAIRENNAAIAKQNSTKIQTLVKDARAAGIHPLAALGSSVAGSFGTPQAAYGGAPITGSAVGDAIKSFGASMPQPDSNAELQAQLLRAQIKNVDASTVQLLADAQSRTKAANAQQHGVTSTMIAGLPTAGNPNFSDVGGPIQQRYGEPAEWLMSIPTMLADAYWNAGSSWREAVERARQDVQEMMRKRGATPR